MTEIWELKLCPRAVNAGICVGCSGTIADARKCTWGKAHPERLIAKSYYELCKCKIDAYPSGNIEIDIDCPFHGFKGGDS